MERYDGKTKKDDYKKYALIALGVVLVIVLYCVITKVIKKVSHPTPDLTVTVACAKVVDYQVQDQIERVLEPMVGDLDGNGREVVEIEALRMVQNEAIAQSGVGAVGAETDFDKLQSALNNGTSLLYLVSDEPRSGYPGAKAVSCKESYCRELPEDLRDGDDPYCTDLTGIPLLEERGFGKIPFYGCIHKNATDAEYDLLVEVLRQLKAL